MTQLWIVGQWIADGVAEPYQAVWHFQGVFETRELAIAAAIDHPTYFVMGPMKLNELLPAELVEPQECFYPSEPTNA